MLRNIVSISSFVFKSLIRIIPKQVIVLFDKTCFHNTEVSKNSNLINTAYLSHYGGNELCHKKISNLINDNNHLVEITCVTSVAL